MKYGYFIYLQNGRLRAGCGLKDGAAPPPAPQRVPAPLAARFGPPAAGSGRRGGAGAGRAGRGRAERGGVGAVGPARPAGGAGAAVGPGGPGPHPIRYLGPAPLAVIGGGREGRGWSGTNPPPLEGGVSAEWFSPAASPPPSRASAL